GLVRLAALEFLWQTGQRDRAAIELEAVLADPSLNQRPAIWRLAGRCREGSLDKAIEAQEQALDMEFRDLPEIVKLDTIRSEYASLLGKYDKIIKAHAVAGMTPPPDLVAKVVKQADRWRSLDPDNVEVPTSAAALLKKLGAEDLAWDYLTTP